MYDFTVPPIPPEVSGKKFGPQDIKWVKSVNDSDRRGGIRGTYSAYLLEPSLAETYLGEKDKRVKQTKDGLFFYLQMNPGFSGNLKVAKKGDLILLYQYLQGPKTKCFTHLVTPITDEIVDGPYPYDDVWPGRMVKVIAITKNETKNSVAFDSTIWRSMNFKGAQYDLSYQRGMLRTIDHNQTVSSADLLKLQQNIWDKFKPYMVNP